MANEKRLIDANEVYELHSNYPMFARSRADLTDLRDILDEATTVDAVEVVRCRDCKNRGDEGMCPMYWVEEIEWDDDGYTELDYVPHDYTVDDGFCDRGERRTDGK